MTDLRDRIAVALSIAMPTVAMHDCMAGADAVIAELKLRKVELPAFDGNPPYTGYVTGWKADNE